jgi:hypothetical protein
MGWLSGWAYRRPITITNNITSALTNYQVLIIIDTQTLISQGKMRSDGGDIRFTDSDGVTLINYWVESGINTNSTRIWVKVPFIPASPEIAIIYLYYGNPNATSLSNGFNTFDFFDDFEDGVYTDKWDANTLNGGTLTETGGKLKMTSGSSTWNGAGVTSKTTLPAGDYAIETYGMRETGYKGGEPGLFFGFSDKTSRDTTYYGFWNRKANGNIAEYAPEGKRLATVYDDAITWGTTALETWDGKWARITVIYKHTAKTTQTRFIYGSTDTTIGPTSAGTNQLTVLYVQIHYGEYGKSGYSAYADWIAIRKYVSPEPTVSIGSEVVIVANSFPMLYLAKPIKAQELKSKIEGATITTIAQDYPKELLKSGKAKETRSKWT